MRDVAALQRRLADVWKLSEPPGGVEHVRIVLPSYNVGPSAYAHYAPRLPALEHRYLVDILRLGQVEGCTLLFVLSEAPEAEVVEYYLSLVPGAKVSRLRERVHTVVLGERPDQPLSARLRERPDVLAEIRRFVGHRPVFIEPWNVTDNEVAIALALDAPLNGSEPGLRTWGYKSDGRRLFAAAGVPTPPGTEDLRSVEGVEAAVAALRDRLPSLCSVVVKLDNSVAGHGNLVVPLRDPDGSPSSPATVSARVRSMPDWYLAELMDGAVVEAYVAGQAWCSPSVQVQITPRGRVMVLATHEQVLGGENGQVYLGCRFPADLDYATRLMRYGRRVGEQLAARGAVGMLSADFAAARSDGDPWGLYGLEINLRRGGTTAPMTVLSSLLPGRYDGRGLWRLADGSPRFYSATDNLRDERWRGLSVHRVIDGVRSAGLEFDGRTGTGVVLHMLSGLAIDGGFGLTAIGRSREESDELSAAVRTLVDGLCDGAEPPGTVRRWTSTVSPRRRRG